MSEKIGQLKFMSSDSKKYKSDATNTQTMFRIIQSIPSPKAENVKQWLASLGNQRVEEGNDPELGMQRSRERAIQVYKSR
ncbi:TPA: phage antirepressor [Patescibacteria group bacterium]|nr:phage antirepressor [Candidatus Gracilibacteria bacterium]